MADNKKKFMENAEEVGRITLWEGDTAKYELVLTTGERNGRKIIDFRQYQESDAYSGPTKKGFVLNEEHFRKFHKLFHKSIGKGA